jgi:hypothetical protein
MDEDRSKLAFLIQSDAKCIDETIGNLLGKYLCDAVTTEEKERFEKHLNECGACWMDVTNWNNLSPVQQD